MQSLNYSALKALESAKTTEAVGELSAKPLNAQKAIRYAIGKLFLYFFGGAILFAILPGTLKLIVVLIGGIYLYRWIEKSNKIRKQAITQFIKDNDLNVDQSSQFIVPSLTLKGAVSQMNGQVLRGQFDQLPYWLYQYQSTIGSGDSRKTTQALVVTIELPKELPDIVLDAVADNAFGTNLPNPPKARGLEPIQLEGNFKKYFTVSLRKGEHIDVLSLITPELMQKLIDDGCLVNIDINHKQVHIFSTIAPMITYSYTKNQLDFAQRLAASLQHKMKNFNASVR